MPLDNHIITSAGHKKTICVSAMLEHFGVPADRYRHTYNATTGQNVWDGILRRAGYAVRSRMSQMPKSPTVGVCRKSVSKIKGDPKGVRYVMRVASGRNSHVIVVDNEGKTLVDTAPRKRDRRAVLAVMAVFPKSG
jgi:hypothetical protein